LRRLLHVCRYGTRDQRRVGDVDKTSAKITWTTNVPADSQVEYGRTIDYGSNSLLDTTLVTRHSVNLTGLNRGTTYHYRVYSRNGAGIRAVSADFIFKTR